MRQSQAALLGDNRRRHRRSQIVDHDDHVDRMLIEETVELGHHLTGNLVQFDTVDTQIELRRSYLKVVEERRLQRGIALTSGIHEEATGLVAPIQRPHQGRHLDEIGPGTSQDTDIFAHKHNKFVAKIGKNHELF